MTRLPSPLWLATASMFGVATTVVLGLGLQYPPTKRLEQRDLYHGVHVSDPYRWLEDDSAPDTLAWVAAQNRLTSEYLSSVPERDHIARRVRELNEYVRYSGPRSMGAFRSGDYVFFGKQEPGKHQPVVYMKRGQAEPQILLDPNEWSTDGTTRLGAFSPSRDGKYLVYGIVRGGSDWQEYRVMELATNRQLPDVLRWIKGVAIGWRGDGFFYTKYPAPPPGQELTAVSENHAVYFHRISTSQNDDVLVHSDPAHPKKTFWYHTTHDERFGLLSTFDRSTGRQGNGLAVRDLEQKDGPWIQIVPEAIDHDFQVVASDSDSLLIRTTYQAPRGRVVRVNIRRPSQGQWVTVIPEQHDLLQVVTTGGSKLFARYLRDVTTFVRVFDYAGRLDHEIALPGKGLAFGFEGPPDTKRLSYTFTSLNVPDTIYEYDLETRTSSVFGQPDLRQIALDDLEVEQVFFPSKDGTRIPMFLLHRRGLRLDGSNPVLLTAYGAFGVSQWPWFDASRLALVEQGFVFALANIRGGGEYGREWHEAGRKLNRQNTFDDFIAAAEWLIGQKYTTARGLGIHGTSSGGTLIGAVINQRPELFRAAVPEAGVMDMLRFQKFTVGFNWISETGSSDDPSEFKFLYGYSPIHNVRAGTLYPATLILTADHDDRVVPAHSFKYAATLQQLADARRPVLLRVETQSGHSASSVEKKVHTRSDMFAFLIRELGVSSVSQ